MESDYCPVISEIKWCQSNFSEKPPKTRDKWVNSYSLPNETFLDRNTYDDQILSDKQKYPIGSTVSAIEAVHLSKTSNLDIRPKVFDNVTKKYVLLDTGSCVSCQPAQPGDLVDPSFKLKSVNGGTIDTYGSKTMTLRIGRKTYSIEAIIAAVPA